MFPLLFILNCISIDNIDINNKVKVSENSDKIGCLCFNKSIVYLFEKTKLKNIFTLFTKPISVVWSCAVGKYTSFRTGKFVLNLESITTDKRFNHSTKNKCMKKIIDEQISLSNLYIVFTLKNACNSVDKISLS